MMVEERNGNIYSQRVANEIQMKLNNCPFTPHNFKLAYDLESYENEMSNKFSEINKVQARLNMENCNSRMFFEAMKLKSMPRYGSSNKPNNELGRSSQFQSMGKFYHLSFEPMRIEDVKELEENRIDDDNEIFKAPHKQKSGSTSDHMNNNRNINFLKNHAISLTSHSSSVTPPTKRFVLEEKSLVLPNVSISKFPKRGSSRKLPAVPNQTAFNRLSSAMPDLIATTKIPSLAEEIVAAYNHDRKNQNKDDYDYIFPQCFYMAGDPISKNVDLGQVTLDDLGMPEMIDPIKKYSDLYLNETYARSIICFLCTHSSGSEPLFEDDEQIKSAVKEPGVLDLNLLSPNKEQDISNDQSLVGSPCSNLERSRTTSKSIEPSSEEIKRDSSIMSRNSDSHSLCSHDSSDAGISFPPGFPDIELYLEESDATHRGCHKFLPRHPEEIAVEIGDSLFVEKEHDDLWCEGINLRTKKRGIFPTAYATDLSLLGTVKYKYFVSFLGSIEVGHHTGHEVLCKAIKKLASSFNKSPSASAILSCLEIEESGIKISERRKKTPTSRILSTIGKISLLKNMQESEHVFLLKNITFCGILPNNDKYLGFITKHPICMKFACHVFLAPTSGRSIVEAIGLHKDSLDGNVRKVQESTIKREDADNHLILQAHKREELREEQILEIIKREMMLQRSQDNECNKRSTIVRQVEDEIDEVDHISDDEWENIDQVSTPLSSENGNSQADVENTKIEIEDETNEFPFYHGYVSDEDEFHVDTPEKSPSFTPLIEYSNDLVTEREITIKSLRIAKVLKDASASPVPFSHDLSISSLVETIEDNVSLGSESSFTYNEHISEGQLLVSDGELLSSVDRDFSKVDLTVFNGELSEGEVDGYADLSQIYSLGEIHPNPTISEGEILSLVESKACHDYADGYADLSENYSLGEVRPTQIISEGEILSRLKSKDCQDYDKDFAENELTGTFLSNIGSLLTELASSTNQDGDF